MEMFFCRLVWTFFRNYFFTKLRCTSRGMENLLKSFLSCLLRNWKTEACSLPWITSRLSVENWMIQKCRSLFLSWALTASRCVWIRTGPSAATRLEPLVKRKPVPPQRSSQRLWSAESFPAGCWAQARCIISTIRSLSFMTVLWRSKLCWPGTWAHSWTMRLCSPVKSSTLLFPCPWRPRLRSVSGTLYTEGV